MPANSRVSLVLGLALVGLGVLFLAQQFFDFNFWDWLWPVALIVFGLYLLVQRSGLLDGLLPGRDRGNLPPAASATVDATVRPAGDEQPRA